MKKLSLVLLLCAVTACSEYREPQANCFAFVSQGPALHNCDFKPLDDLEDTAP